MEEFQPIKFIPVTKAFKPMVEVVFLADVSGWVNRDRRIKFHAGAGSTHAIDEDNALDWVAKGYCAYKDPRQYKKSGLTESVIAERKASVHQISLSQPGGNNG